MRQIKPLLCASIRYPRCLRTGGLAIMVQREHLGAAKLHEHDEEEAGGLDRLWPDE